MAGRHRVLTARQLYALGAAGDGWCCKQCHAPFMTPTRGAGARRTYLRLLAHRLVRHGLWILPRGTDGKPCTHHVARTWTVWDLMTVSVTSGVGDVHRYLSAEVNR